MRGFPSPPFGLWSTTLIFVDMLVESTNTVKKSQDPKKPRRGALSSPPWSWAPARSCCCNLLLSKIWRRPGNIWHSSLKQLLCIMTCIRFVFVTPKGRAPQTPLPPSCKTWSCQLLSLLHPSQLSTLGFNFFGKVCFVNTAITIYLSSFPTFAEFWTSFPEPAAISCKLVVCCTALPPRPAEDGLALVTEAENMAIMRLRDRPLDYLQGPSLGRLCKDVFAWP